MWPAKTKRHAKTLGIAHDNIGSPFAGRFKQGQCQQVGCDAKQCTLGMRLGRCVLPVL